MQDQVQLTETETLEQRNIMLEKALHQERIQGSQVALALVAQRETAFGDKVRARINGQTMIDNAELGELHKADGSVVPLKTPEQATA